MGKYKRIMIKVFIEQICEPNKKNIFDKKTGQLSKSVVTSITYPYPYGYILNTRASDGENLDCYIISNKQFEVSDVIECEPIGMVEWFENGEADHKIIATPINEKNKIDDVIKNKITDFANQFIALRFDKKYRLGKFYDKKQAKTLISDSYYTK